MNRLGFIRAIPAQMGTSGYNPKDLLKPYIYGYMNRIRSSRRLEKVTSGERHRVYRNFNACGNCRDKEKCTKAKRGREVSRWIHQNILDKIDQRTKENKEKYRQRQMIVEHPFGTVKGIEKGTL